MAIRPPAALFCCCRLANFVDSEAQPERCGAESGSAGNIRICPMDFCLNSKVEKRFSLYQRFEAVNLDIYSDVCHDTYYLNSLFNAVSNPTPHHQKVEKISIVKKKKVLNSERLCVFTQSSSAAGLSSAKRVGAEAAADFTSVATDAKRRLSHL